MQIETIESRLYNIPLGEVLTDARHGEMRHFAVVFVRVRCADGSEGTGYTYTVGKMGGTAIHAMIQDDIAPFLIGQDAGRIEQIWEALWWKLHYVGRGGLAAFAIAALDIALWDLKGCSYGEPLWRLLGGHDNKARVYAGGIDLKKPIDALQAQTQRNLDKGFRAVKMKVGNDHLEEDLERVAAVREVLGDLPLMVDANMRWTIPQAIKASRAFADHDVYWLEEPTIPDHVAGHAQILRDGLVPLAAGENLRTIYEFNRFMVHEAVSYPEPDVSNLGGITPWMKVAHAAEAFNLPVTTHGVHDLHVHLLAAIPNASFLEAHGFGLEAFIEEPLTFIEGWATANNRPGHGIVFLWDKLEEHRAA